MTTLTTCVMIHRYGNRERTPHCSSIYL